MVNKLADFFENVNDESVSKAVNVKPTFQLPKIDDEPMVYVINGTPFEIETPNSKFNKTAWKMPVCFNEIEGEIFIPDSLKFQIAVAMKQMKLEFSTKNLTKIVGKSIRIWKSASNVDGNEYYNCQIF